MLKHLLTNTLKHSCAHFKNHYQTLQVAEGANFKEIKEKYILKSKIYHPDVAKDTQQIYHQIQSAYRVLISPESRKKYDLSLGIQTSLWEKEIIGAKFTEDFQTQHTYQSVLNADQPRNANSESLEQNLQREFSQQIDGFSYFSFIKSFGFAGGAVVFALSWAIWSGAELFYLNYRGDVVHKIDSIHSATALKIVPLVTR